MTRNTNKKPKLPKSVVIGGCRIKIRIVRNMEDWGEYDHDNKLIAISHRCFTKEGELRSTLRHEILHAALSIGGMSFMQHYEEECVVRCLDEIFFPAWERVSKKYFP